MNKKIIVNVLSAVMIAAALIGLYTIGADKNEERSTYSDSKQELVQNSDSIAERPDTNITTVSSDPESKPVPMPINDTDSNSLETFSDKKHTDKDNPDTDKPHSHTDSESTDSDTSGEQSSVVNNDSDTQNADTDIDGDKVIPYRGIWNEIVVNKYNPIPDFYEFTLTELDNGKQVDSRIVEPLTEMFSAARESGINPTVGEAYRTWEDQEEIMQSYISGYVQSGMSYEQAEEEAKKWVAQPGTSEHQLGLSLDINGDGISTPNDAVYEWLAENAYQYGFVLRYPQGKEDITGIDYEPWHYRYVGADAAREMHDSGQCLEEYVSGDD